MTWSKESRQSRGYGAEWDRLRKRILERDKYLCQCDKCKGGELRVTPANEVDHIKPKAQGGTDDPINLRSLHHDCHVRITAEQRGYKDKPKVRIGVDGWPVPE